MKCKWNEVGMCDREATEFVKGRDGKQLPHCSRCAGLVRILGVEMMFAARGSSGSNKNGKTLIKEFRERMQ
tara:strand:- start:353 stop:565 length:213 start_codon:yes stop_codon:yes gene_type:complete